MSVNTILASEAGDALGVVAHRLLTANVVEPEGYAVLNRVSRQIRQGRSSTTWKVDVGRGDPVRFVSAMDKNGNPVVPSLVCAISVDQTSDTRPPFSQLDIALEVNDNESNPIARWHVDLANSDAQGFQDGPLFHLQYGGHNAGHRHLDHPLKTPRWCHPPMELALMCEVVTANFFSDKWEGIRDDPNWCEAICLYQKLCYSNYFDKLQRCLSIRSSTLLQSTWAAHWM